ncbi:MAG: ComF family protein, partial [Alphaproteobacteria bacterium]|nr:ComF family protein [Alphaproteobacteria bacterium]
MNGGGNPWIARVWRGVLDVLLPPMCLGCGETVEGTAALCTACWKKTRFLSAPACACCGLPFEAAAGPDALCGECIRERPPFARARAAFVYDEKSRGMILAFKHGDRTELAPAFAHWLTRAGADLIADAAVIVPVP